jgi:hypothetical protein
LSRRARRRIVDLALPFRLKVVALGAGAIDALRSSLWRRHRRIFGKLALFFEKRPDFAFDFLIAFSVQQFLFG